MPVGHPVETSTRERSVRHTRLAVRTEGLNQKYRLWTLKLRRHLRCLQVSERT